MTEITVEKLYELCDVIDSAEKKAECQKEYESILNGVKCKGANEKRLTATLIARYFAHFFDMRDKSLDAMFELCEDDDVNIRKLVIKELPNLCRGDGGSHISKIADILVQLLQTDDQQEQQIVNSSLFTLLKSHPKDTLSAIFGHILNVEIELIRERAVRFLAMKLKLLPEDVLTKPIEEFVLEQSKKVLQDVSGEEFILFMLILSHLKHLQTVAGRQSLLDIVVDQADLDKPFQATDPDRVDQIIQCMKQSIPFLSKNVHSCKFLLYVLENIFPVLGSLGYSNKNGTNSKQETSVVTNGDEVEKLSTLNIENPRLEILRLTTDMSHFLAVNEMKDFSAKIDTVFEQILIFLPLPTSATETENGENDPLSLEEPKIQFSELECLIWILHNLCCRCPEYFDFKSIPTDENSDERDEKLKEFKKRLQYLARVIQIYSKKLKDSLNGKKKEELKTEANRIKLIGLKTTLNISNAIKDFLHIPPTFKAVITPSWKAHNVEKKDEDTQKRSNENGNNYNNNNANKMQRKNVEYYHPPSGKFSKGAGAFLADDDFSGLKSAPAWRRGASNSNNRSRGGFRRGRGRW